MKNTKELSFDRQRENNDRPLDAKEELLRRALVLQDEVEKFLDILPYDTVLIGLQMQIIGLQDNILLPEAGDVTTTLNDINRQLDTYRAQASNP